MSGILLGKQASVMIALGLIIPCLLISIPPLIAFTAQKEVADSFQWVSHTIEAQRQLQRLLSLLVDAEAGSRGFLLSGHDTYLEPYKSAIGQIPIQIESLRNFTADNPIQRSNIRLLDPLVADKLGLMARTISLQQHDRHDEALALVNTDQGKKAMDEIRARIELMNKEESQLLTKRENLLASSARFSTGFLCSLIAIYLLFAVAILVMLRRLIKVHNLVTICAWSRTVEYEGKWITFEEYLLRRFNLNASHGISPVEVQKAFGDPLQK